MTDSKRWHPWAWVLTLALCISALAPSWGWLFNEVPADFLDAVCVSASPDGEGAGHKPGPALGHKHCGLCAAGGQTLGPAPQALGLVPVLVWRLLAVALPTTQALPPGSWRPAQPRAPPLMV